MPDILIRDVPEHVVRELDARAKDWRISRNEVIRRTLIREATPRVKVTKADFEKFNEAFADLADEEVMRQAWS